MYLPAIVWMVGGFVKPRLSSAIVLLFCCAMSGAQAQGQSDVSCPMDDWSRQILAHWQAGSRLSDTATRCYAQSITSMESARLLGQQVALGFDRMLPRAAYKVVGLDPVNAALDGVDRPMVGVMHLGMFLPDGATVPLDSAELLITEPDILFRVADAGINQVSTLEEVLNHIDRVYAFIEVPAPLFNNNPANAYLMQASNLLPRWGVIGESMAVTASNEFLRSLETMKVSFLDGDGKVLGSEPGAYLGGNPLNGVLVVLEELRRRGEQLQPGDLISAGSFMPPIPATPGLATESVYEGIGGETLTVSASYR